MDDQQRDVDKLKWELESLKAVFIERRAETEKRISELERAADKRISDVERIADARIAELEQAVSKLKEDRTKLTGGIIFITALGGVLLWILSFGQSLLRSIGKS